jgi:hypothetical protein
MLTVPSAFWLFSISATTRRGKATPEPLSVCRNCGLPFPSRQRIRARRD